MPRSRHFHRRRALRLDARHPQLLERERVGYIRRIRLPEFTAPVVALFFVAFVMLFFSAYAIAQRRVRAAPEFSRLMIASAIYALGYGLELMQSTAQSMLTVVRIAYPAIVASPVFWLFFALAFSRVPRPRPAIVALAFLLPLCVVVAVWTNDAHHLYYVRTWVRDDGPLRTFAFERGPIYFAGMIYFQVCVVVGDVALVLYAIRSPRPLRKQAIVAVIGSIGPWIGNLSYIAGKAPWGVDPLPFSLALSGCFCALALFGLGLFELVPSARDRAIESLRDGFLVVDGRGRILDANEAAGRLLGEWATREGGSLDASEPGGPELLGILEKGEAEVRFALSSAKGERRQLVAHSFPVRVGRRGREGSGFLLRDETENAALLERLAGLAGTDDLTGLYNRRRFSEYAARELALAIREGRFFTVAILDIDYFKDVNDRHGHAVGDVVLCEFASRLSAAVREIDILCRYGGEEFALVLPGSDEGAALAAVERIRRAATSRPIAFEGGELELRASAGVYSALPSKGQLVDAFLDEADRALYEAKEKGRDRTIQRGA
jgi:diguanylate cyclase (GGDEF)-like protein